MQCIKKMFNRERPADDATRLTLERAQHIVEEYGNFLKISATLPGRVADTNALPHAKETIKTAITVCIYLTRDPVRTEQLRYNYLMLSNWQDDVGAETLGVDFTQLDLSVDPIALNELIQEISVCMEKWTPIIEAEQKQLQAELKAMGAYRSRALM